MKIFSKIRLSLLVSLAAFITAVAAADAQSIAVEVTPSVVVEGERFSVVYQLKDSQSNPSQISMPDIEGCNKLSSTPGVTSSTSINVINGKRTQSSTVSYAFNFRAITAGSYTIPPATLIIDGKEVKTKSATIKVLPPDQSAPANTYPGQGGSASQGNNGAGSTTASTGDDSFVQMRVNKTHVYEHEAIECTLTLYTHEQQPSLNYKTTPSFDGFLTYDVDGFRGQPTMDNINGRNYYIFPLRKYIVFPQKTGKIEINPGSLTMTVTEYEMIQTFFGRQAVPVGEREVTVKGRNTTIDVASLPTPRPVSFAGAVGRFTLESKLMPEALRTGEAATLTVTLTGTGNINSVKTPVPEFPIDFEQYTPSEDIVNRVSGTTLTGSVTTEYTVVPQSVGTFDIPQLEFSYFDTSSKQYVTLTSGGYSVNVAKGAGGTTATVVEQQDIARRATDILHIHRTNPGALSRTTPRPAILTAGFWIVWLAIVAAAVVLLLMWKRNMSRRADVTGMKTARAGRVARTRLRRARSYMSAGDSEAFHAEVLKAIWGYISDRLAIPAADLTRANISERLSGHGLSGEQIGQVIAVIDECEMARYTPTSEMRQMSEIYHDASGVMDILSGVKPSKS